MSSTTVLEEHELNAFVTIETPDEERDLSLYYAENRAEVEPQILEQDSIDSGLFDNASMDTAEPPSTSQSANYITDFPEGGFKAYSVVLGSFLGLIANFGTLNSVGAIQAYIATHQLAGVDASTISWIFSIYMSLSFFFAILVGPFFDLKGSFIPLVAGTILEFVGFMAVAQSSTVWQFILSLSICVGVGNALCITPLVSVVSHWFLEKRGRATGIATIGGSVGGIVIPLMLRSLYPQVGFAWAIRILAFFCLGCMLCAIVLARERLRGTSDLPATESKRKQLLQQSKHFLDFSTLKDLKYTFLIAGVFFTEIALMALVTYYATYAIAQGMDESTSYVLLTIFNATGVLGRLLPGYLSDKVGHFNVMILMLIGVDLSIFLLWLPFGSSFAVLYAFSAICGFFSSSILSLTPVCLGSITSVHKFGQRYGLLYFFVSIGNLVGIPIGAAIIANGSKHNYSLFAMFCGIFAVVGTGCWIISRYYLVGFKINVKL